MIMVGCVAMASPPKQGVVVGNSWLLIVNGNELIVNEGYSWLLIYILVIDKL